MCADSAVQEDCDRVYDFDVQPAVTSHQRFFDHTKSEPVKWIMHKHQLQPGKHKHECGYQNNTPRNTAENMANSRWSGKYMAYFM